MKTLQRYLRQSRAKSLEILADSPSLRIFLRRFYRCCPGYLLGRRRRGTRVLFHFDRAGAGRH